MSILRGCVVTVRGCKAGIWLVTVGVPIDRLRMRNRRLSLWLGLVRIITISKILATSDRIMRGTRIGFAQSVRFWKGLGLISRLLWKRESWSHWMRCWPLGILIVKMYWCGELNWFKLNVVHLWLVLVIMPIVTRERLFMWCLRGMVRTDDRWMPRHIPRGCQPAIGFGRPEHCIRLLMSYRVSGNEQLTVEIVHLTIIVLG